jgi:UDP-N-acetylglucosamine 2-epimerase (non-hydrolysing)
MLICNVVGARPNFMKIGPIVHALQRRSIPQYLVHTGQHYDANMSKVFFDELEMPRPAFYLGISGGSHAVQTAAIMVEFEKVLLAEKPDMVIVPGDVNSTMACTLVASKMGIPVAHVESGLRSFDRGMPEEINRILTDVLADMLFVSERSGLVNLRKEGIADEKVFLVGNIMIDSLIHYLPKIELSDILGRMNTGAEKYILVTFHRPSNVDEPATLKEVVSLLTELSEKAKVVFPVHPRTRNNLIRMGAMPLSDDRLILCDPIGYIDFLALVKNAALVVTDSGGIQEETTYLGVQCITVRDNTERPVTVDVGTNQLTGTDFSKVKAAALSVLNGNIKTGSVPEL